MPFADKQNMLSRFGERELLALTDRENAGVIGDDLLTQELLSAEGEINAYLQGRYSLPLANVPVIVRDYCCDIARYRLSGAEVTETEVVRNRYKDAISFFVRVSKGEISLGLDLTNAQAASTGVTKIKSNEPVFNKANLADY